MGVGEWGGGLVQAINGGLYIEKLPLTANTENLINVNKIIKIALIM